MSVKVESYRSNSPAQCFSCQRFGHSSLHCGYAPRCVKCAGPHQAKECTKTKEMAPKCVNCEGDHTANYSKCPALIREKISRRPDRPNTTNNFFPNIRAGSSEPIPEKELPIAPQSKSYATITAKNTPSQEDSKSILAQLTALIPQLQSGKAKVKDALLLVLTILPLLLSQNE